MGEPAELSEQDRQQAHELAALVLSQIENDEALPIIDDNRAFLLAGEIRILKKERDSQAAHEAMHEAAWRETCAAVDARIGELEEQLSCVQAEHSLDRAALDEAREQLKIGEVNRLALQREKDELLVKLQSTERSLDRERSARLALVETHSGR